MDFTKPINAQGGSSAPKTRSWLGRIGLFLLTLCILLIALVAALPTLLSTAGGRGFLLANANKALAPATLTLADASFAWFGEQKISGIVYTDDRLGVKASVKEVSLNGLWHWLPFGTLTAQVAIHAPDVLLYAPIAPETPSEGVATLSPQPAPQGAESSKRFILPAWKVVAHLSITEASVRSATLSDPLLSHGALEVDMPGLDATITSKLSASILNAKLVASTELPAPLELATRTGRPLPKTATLFLDAPWGEGRVNLLSNAEHPLPEGEVALTCSLPELLNELQRVGVVLPDTTLTKGKLSLALALKQGETASTHTLTADLRTQEIAGAYQKTPFAFSPKVNLVATFNPQKLEEAQVQRLSLELPGVLASGEGSLEKGTLSARVEAAALLEMLRPFVGEIALPRPLVLLLQAQMNDRSGSLVLSATSEKSEVAKLTIEAEDVNPATRSVRSAKVALQGNVKPLATFASLPKDWELDGSVYLNGALTGSLADFRSRWVFALQNLHVSSTSWAIREARMLEGKAEITRADNAAIVLSGLSFESPLLKGTGQATLEPGKSFPEATLNGVCTPAVLATWQKPAKGEEPTALNGSIAFAFATSQTASGVPSATAQITSSDFAIRSGETPAIPLPFSLNSAVELGKPILIRDVSFSSAPLALQAQGEYAQDGGTLKLNGTLTPDFAALWALPPCASLRESGIAISGKQSAPFSFEAPLQNGAAGIFNYGKGEAEVRFERITIPGLDIPGGTAKGKLAEGVASLDGRFRVNGGEVILAPRINLAVKPYVLSFPEKSTILKDVQLTQELLDTGLKTVTPLLAGSASPNGVIHLKCDHWRMELGEQAIRSLDTALTLQTRQCRMAPNGIVGTILGLLRVREQVATLPDQDVEIGIKEGKLTCAPLKVSIAGTTLTCSGTTDLATRELDYTLSLPFVSQLLGKGQTQAQTSKALLLPIRGTIDKPKVDTSPVLDFLRASMVGQATKKASAGLEKALSKSKRAGKRTGSALKETLSNALDGASEGGDALDQKLDNALRSLFDGK